MAPRLRVCTANGMIHVRYHACIMGVSTNAKKNNHSAERSKLRQRKMIQIHAAARGNKNHWFWDLLCSQNHPTLPGRNSALRAYLENFDSRSCNVHPLVHSLRAA